MEWPDILQALQKGPPAPEKRDGRPIVLFQTLWQHPADGWAIASRAYARAMHMAGVDVRLVSWGAPLDMCDEVLEEVGHLIEPPTQWDLHIFSSTLSNAQAMAPTLKNFSGHPGPKAFYSVFERRFIEPSIVKALNQLNVWVQCKMNYEVMKRAGVTNLTWIPFPYFDDDPHLKIEPSKYTRTFYYIGRFEPRKAPENIIRAFMRGFKRNEAELVIKTSPIPWDKEYYTPEQVIAEELERSDVRSNGWDFFNWQGPIKLFSGIWPKERMRKLHEYGDVYVSASRGEGLDLPAFAAKLAGRKLITTASGGPEDFAGEHDTVIPARGLIPADARYEWGRGANYIDYNLEDLIAAMQYTRASTLPAKRDWPMHKFQAETVGKQLKYWIDGFIGAR